MRAQEKVAVDRALRRDRSADRHPPRRQGIQAVGVRPTPGRPAGSARSGRRGRGWTSGPRRAHRPRRERIGSRLARQCRDPLSRHGGGARSAHSGDATDVAADRRAATRAVGRSRRRARKRVQPRHAHLEERRTAGRAHPVQRQLLQGDGLGPADGHRDAPDRPEHDLHRHLGRRPLVRARLQQQRSDLDAADRDARVARRRRVRHRPERRSGRKREHLAGAGRRVRSAERRPGAFHQDADSGGAQQPADGQRGVGRPGPPLGRFPSRGWSAVRGAQRAGHQDRPAQCESRPGRHQRGSLPVDRRRDLLVDRSSQQHRSHARGHLADRLSGQRRRPVAVAGERRLRVPENRRHVGAAEPAPPWRGSAVVPRRRCALQRGRPLEEHRLRRDLDVGPGGGDDSGADHDQCAHRHRTRRAGRWIHDESDHHRDLRAGRYRAGNVAPGRLLPGAAGADRRYDNRVAGCTVMNLGHVQSYYNLSVSVDPGNASRAIFGGDLCSAITKDGGLTYAASSHWLPQGGSGFTANGFLPYVHADWHTSLAFRDAGGQSVLLAGTDGGLFVTRSIWDVPTPELGQWQQPNVGLTTHLFYGIGTGDPTLGNPNVVLGGTQDNGTRWRLLQDDSFIQDFNAGNWDQIVGGDGIGAAVTSDTAGQNQVYWASVNGSRRFCRPRSHDCTQATRIENGVESLNWVSPGTVSGGDPFFIRYTPAGDDTSGVLSATNNFGLIWFINQFDQASIRTLASTANITVDGITATRNTRGMGFRASPYRYTLDGLPKTRIYGGVTTSGSTAMGSYSVIDHGPAPAPAPVTIVSTNSVHFPGVTGGSIDSFRSDNGNDNTKQHHTATMDAIDSKHT